MMAVLTSGRVEQARDPNALAVVLGILSILPVAVRRRHPLAALWAATIPQTVFTACDYAGAGWLGVLIMLYSVAVHVDAPARLRHAGAVVAIGATTTFVLAVTGVTEWGNIVFTLVILPSAFILGDNIRRRRERLAELADRADRAEHERELVAHQRVIEERTRIARELHDVVAHSLSVMVIQAAAARRQLTRKPEQATEALQTIESHGRQAMNEMRRVLGVLRSDPAHAAELAPVPSLSDLAELVDADPDHPAALTVIGDVEDLPPGVELSAYRVIQEALTNIRKHAGPGPGAAVAIDRRPDDLVIDVTDRGRGASTLTRGPIGGPVGGLGLLGMRERVATCGGQLDAGPRPGGGWHVRAVFPLDASRTSRPVETTVRS